MSATETRWQLPPLTQDQYDILDAVITFALERYEGPDLHPTLKNYRDRIAGLYELVKRAGNAPA